MEDETRRCTTTNTSFNIVTMNHYSSLIETKDDAEAQEPQQAEEPGGWSGWRGDRHRHVCVEVSISAGGLTEYHIRSETETLVGGNPFLSVCNNNN